MLSDKLRRCATHYPDKVAYYQGDRSRNWKDVYERAKKLAGAMQAMGVKPGDRVGVVCKECIEVYEHFYACVLIGAVRVGINWRYSPREMLHVISNSALNVCIIQDSCKPLIDPVLAEVQQLDCTLIGLGDDHGIPLDFEGLIADDAPCDIVAVDGKMPLLHTYTSGVTADPKGVVLSHHAIETEISVVPSYYCLSGADIYYNPAQSAWVAILGGMFGLSNGMTTVIPHDLFDVNNYLKDVERRKVTASLLVPAMMQSLCDIKDEITNDISSLKTVAYGSAPSTPALIRNFSSTFGVDLVQLYGMTECCAWAAFMMPDDHRKALKDHPEILKASGRFATHVDYRICSEEGVDVPPGETGIIWLKGDTIMTEYLNLPEQTKEVLQPDGWLITNDIGRVDENGYVYITDRQKSLINTGGVNVFPSMVESVISEMPEISEVSVVGVPHPRWGEAVVAAVVVLDKSISNEEIQKLVLAYSVTNLSKLESPKHVEVMEALPRTFSGKLDKNNLRKYFVENNITDW